jgi:hypothetical protein
VAESLWVRRLDGSGLKRLLIDDVVLKIPIYRMGLANRIVTLNREYGFTRQGWWVLAKPRIAAENEACEVTPSEVRDDLERVGIPIPRELVDDLKPRLRWDETGPPYRLWYGEMICLEYVKRAGPQFVILRAFQKADWSESIDRPIDDKGRTLDDHQIKNAVANIQKHLNGKKAPIWIEGLSRLRWYPRQIPPS